MDFILGGHIKAIVKMNSLNDLRIMRNHLFEEITEKRIRKTSELPQIFK